MPSCLSKENNDDLVMATSKLNLDQDTPITNASKAVKNKIVMKVSAVPNSAELTPKKQYLTVRRLSDDEISEADSMTRYLYLFLIINIKIRPRPFFGIIPCVFT